MINGIIIASIILCNILIGLMLYEVWRLSKFKQTVNKWLNKDKQDWKEIKNYINNIPIKEK